MGRAPKKPTEKPFKCTNCTKAYATASGLKAHNRIEHLRIMFVCVYPGYGSKYTRKAGLDSHVRSAHEKVKWPCLVEGCSKDFAQKDGRNKHMQSVHKNILYYCKIDSCDKAYTDRSSLRHHIRRDHEEIRHFCRISDCEAKFTTYQARNDHIRLEHEGVRLRCRIDNCENLYARRCGLIFHINSAHLKITHRCDFEDCEAVFTGKQARDKHIRAIHQGVRYSCKWDSCDRTYAYSGGLEEHIKSVHLGEVWECVYSDCDCLFSTRKGLNFHIESKHFGTVHACTDCDRVFVNKRDQAWHVKTIHGTPEDAAELREKKLQIRQHLAEKEAQGVCSATKTCQNPAIEGSFCCEYHQKTVDCVAKALKEKSESGTLSEFSLKNADEFALLLQRQMIYLDPEAKAALHLLARGLDDVQIAANSYAMDTEFYWTGEYTAMDITIERLNGEEIVSTRVDLDMDIEELQELCSNPISRNGIRKVYGKSDRTWGMKPDQIAEKLKEAGISSDSII